MAGKVKLRYLQGEAGLRAVEVAVSHEVLKGFDDFLEGVTLDEACFEHYVEGVESL